MITKSQNTNLWGITCVFFCFLFFTYPGYLSLCTDTQLHKQGSETGVKQAPSGSKKKVTSLSFAMFFQFVMRPALPTYTSSLWPHTLEEMLML